MTTKPMRRESPSAESGVGSPFSLFRSEMDRLMDRFFRDPWSEGWFGPVAGWTPTLDVSATDAQVLVRVELPGVDPSDLDLSVTGNVLTISGEKKKLEEKDDGRCHHIERSFGSFRRSVQLPAEIDLESIVAASQQGVLTIAMNKTPEETPRKIEIRRK